MGKGWNTAVLTFEDSGFSGPLRCMHHFRKRKSMDFIKQLIFRRPKQGSELLSLERSSVEDTRLGCFWSCCPWINALYRRKDIFQLCLAEFFHAFAELGGTS